MKHGPDESTPVPGLRERKKARTKTEIQRQALRLFREQGYQATTVEQVAAAAEVAPSTVFRYFATKEDLAALDEYFSLDARVEEAFKSQPPELSALQALRAALRAAFSGLTPSERDARYDRDLGMVRVPELWTANAPLLSRGLRTLDELVATRTGRPIDDPDVRALTGAVLGVALRVFLRWSEHPDTDLATALDAELAHLESALAI